MSDYDGLSREQLVERLRAAEDVCVMHGWCPIREEESDREKALTVLWRRWCDMVGLEFLHSKAQPHLSDAHIAELAIQRDEHRAAMQRALDRVVVVESGGA